MSTIYVFNGPNLNALGTREPELYGSQTLDDVRERCRRVVESAGHDLDFRQTNHEGVLIDWIQEAGAAAANERALGVVCNPGAYAHTSIALHDAVAGTAVPVYEVHITNVHAREEYRHTSYLSSVAAGIVVGFGVNGYELALAGLLQAK